MPKYFEFKVCGYYLYFTSFCIVEAFHVHASDSKLSHASSAKFFVKADGESILQEQGILTNTEVNKIKRFIKKNYVQMYLKWNEYSSQGFYKGV